MFLYKRILLNALNKGGLRYYIMKHLVILQNEKPPYNQAFENTIFVDKLTIN